MLIVCSMLMVARMILSVNADEMIVGSNENLTSKQRMLGLLPQGSFRIYNDYGYSDSKFPSTDPLYSKYIYAKKILEKLKQYFATVLTVVGQSQTYAIPNLDTSDGALILANSSLQYDLYVWIYVFSNASDPWDYTSRILFQDPVTNRPLVGKIRINLFLIKPTYANVVHYFGSFVSGFYQLVAFNSKLFPFFVDSNFQIINISKTLTKVTLNNKTYTGYIGKNALGYARTFLNDPNLSYILLENSGGSELANNFWEAMYWPIEFMSSINSMPNILTGLSLSVAVDSGWYLADFSWTSNLTAGYNAGPGFQSGGCPSTIKGFCTDFTANYCSSEGIYKSVCSNDPQLSDGCGFLNGTVSCIIPDSSSSYGSLVDFGFEILGVGSRCAVFVATPGGQTSSKCGKASCDTTSAVTYTFLGGVTCQCTIANQGSQVSCTGSSTAYTIKCPANNTEICINLAGIAACPNDCSGQGVCLGPPGDKKCFCMFGFGGVDCSFVSQDALPTNQPTLAPSTDFMYAFGYISHAYISHFFNILTIILFVIQFHY